MNYWKERTQSLGSYILMLLVLGLLFSGIIGIYRYFFPRKQQATSNSSIKTVESGGTANITNINYKPEDTNQGLYVSLASNKATVGVYKQLTSRFEIQLGAGEDYEGNAVADVTGKVKF